jgi:hypothetical protein
MAQNEFKRIYRLGISQNDRGYGTYVKVEYTGGRLSITGVEGPKSNGDCAGGCGQIEMSLDGVKFREGWPADRVARLLALWREWHLNDMQAGCAHQRATWDVSEPLALTDYSWSTQYHQLRTKAAAGALTPQEYADYAALSPRVQAVTTAIKRPKTETSEVAFLIAGGWIIPGKSETKAAGWVYPEEHPGGLLCKPCEVCGYRYGSAWLKQEVPEDILAELLSFPETTCTPAWC